MIEHVPVERDGNRELSVPTEWREIITAIVERLANDDFGFDNQVSGMLPISPSDASRIEKSIRSYGDKLVSLPQETWKTSIYQATQGGWEVLVDLHTEEEGASDLVLFLFVTELDANYNFKIQSVHVP